ncbi:helix-turn-helix domain-containing protein [Streptomyces sp. NPDC056190]|uniref:helix-turn-helix domain-containing protein n=1 Tax=Streptomyces sp. NPDC056190 TaxID=3345741 RepID=UPI0035DF98DC
MPVPVATACPIALAASERYRLTKMAWGHKTELRLRLRAQIVLHAARGLTNARIAERVGVHVDTVRRWRGRFAEKRLPGLADRKRTGRPPSFTALQNPQVAALACQLPAETGVPLSRWSCPELAREAVERRVAPFLSASTVPRWLTRDALKPWQHRSWIFITDPGFRAKAERVLDLYARTWNGTRLGADEYVISADEKTSIQARCRCHRPGICARGPQVPAGAALRTHRSPLLPGTGRSVGATFVRRRRDGPARRPLGRPADHVHRGLRHRDAHPPAVGTGTPQHQQP